MNEQWERVAPISFMLPREDSKDNVDRLRREYLADGALLNDSRTAQALGKLYGDAITGFPVHRMANVMCRHSPRPVWYYELAYVGEHSFYEDPLTRKPIGVAHHDDLRYLFTMKRFPPIRSASVGSAAAESASDGSASGDRDAAMVDRMTAIFYNFMRFGDPHPLNQRDSDTPKLSGLRWPKMTPHQRQFLSIGDQLTVAERLKEDRFRLWDELYPIQY